MDRGMDSSWRAWTTGNGEPFVPPERRLVLDGPALLHQLALLVRTWLDGTAGEAERQAAGRLVDRVLPPEPPPAPPQPGDRRPS
jgi:hypothetical protein